jgi:hypothetical protein
VEEAASLPSDRHASRDNDNVLIWSLLFIEKPLKHQSSCGWQKTLITGMVSILDFLSPALQESRAFEV